jgi:hypothetical protein
METSFFVENSVSIFSHNLIFDFIIVNLFGKIVVEFEPFTLLFILAMGCVVS